MKKGNVGKEEAIKDHALGHNSRPEHRRAADALDVKRCQKNAEQRAIKTATPKYSRTE